MPAATSLTDRHLGHALLCRYHDDIEELLRLATHGLLFEAAPVTFFAENVTPVVARLLDSLGETYGEQLALSTAQQPGALSQAMQGAASLLRSDIDAALTNDPATADPLEVVFCYPGFKAVAAHRIAHVFFSRGLPLLPRMIAELAHTQTGIDIHPGAQIGSHFFIDHGTGVVIGETAIIGDGVTLYQGVTLGAKRFQRDEHGVVIKGQPRHPVLGDGVTVYAGAAILGRINIGAHSIIGGNVWLTESVAAHSRITQQHYVTGYFKDGDGI